MDRLLTSTISKTTLSAAGAILLLFLLRISAWTLSDFWYDEIITLGDFVANAPQAPWWFPFRVYPVANNHMLFTFAARLWLRICPFGPNELSLRLLPILFSVGTLGVVAFGWRRWLGERLAWLGALLLAISPVYAAFAYQFRGYSLSVLLAAIALSGTLELAYGHRGKGLLLAVPSALLLPLVIPTNAILVVALLLFLALRSSREARPRWQRWQEILPLAIAVAAGGGYYLTIWPQFKKVLAQTAGWDSSGLVLANLVLALVAHLGVLAILATMAAVRGKNAATVPAASGPGRKDALWLLLSCLLPIILMLTVLDPAPFPRVFLIFLPPLTFAALACSRPYADAPERSMRMLVLAVIINGFAWEAVATWHTQRQVAAGKHPQNLLQQHYRGHSFSPLCQQIADSVPNPAGLAIVVDAHDYVPFRYYWRHYGPIEHVLNAGDPATPGKADALRRRGCPLVAVAVSERGAAQLFKQAGYPGPFLPGPGTGHRTAYMAGTPPVP